MKARPGLAPVPDWMPDFIPAGVVAACREPGIDPEVFFPVGQDGARPTSATVTAAKQICARCPVKDPCAEWAIDAREQFGLWGGLTPEERKVLRLQRARELVS